MNEQLDRIESKLDALDARVDQLDRSLAVHKVKTGWISVVVGASASILVAIAAVLLGGCA